MESAIEGLVDLFLTRCGGVFTSPQFELIYDPTLQTGGSAPDIVALDFRHSPREVVVVEVTTSSALAALYARIDEREQRWFRPLRSHLTELGAIDDSWNIRFLGFVRGPNIDAARRRFADTPNVAFHAIEDAMLPYDYWQDRMAHGLPR